MSTSYEATALRVAAVAAVRAPSLHNSQPWRFRLHDGGIEILSDPARQQAIADSTGWAVRIACGAATFNARIALAVAGTPADVRWRPYPAEPQVLARLTPARPRPATYAEQDLYSAIPRRHSNRRPFRPEPVPSDIRHALIEAARTEGAWLDLLVGMTALSGFAEIAQSADRVLRRNPEYQAELAGWTHADAAADGVPATAGAPVVEPQDLLPQRAFTDRRRAPGRDFEPEPLVAVLGVAGDGPTDHLIAGHALQRVLLTVTDAGLACSMISQPIEVPAAREHLRISLRRSGTPQMTLRIGYGDPGRPTPRRDVDDVLVQPGQPSLRGGG
ncbi:Acg family FMN-binding oxidoreductase [Couchioplanes caeruleus]|uniref:Nitroreductase n=2 Tax=Couchioplanes caeruleus TaxID=56438 RepID=A0A1K0FQD3_9ACTN|nr:nitroreductase family protein [Couchioplanes caeruleus]OJF14993.1 nitroreductase [Couchioplanes caeruleus subsp. caeruleus]ROP28280.1 nitroreductase [Couchioplanes caeruleus]